MNKSELVSLLLQDITSYINKLKQFDESQNNLLTCDNCFVNNDNYQSEKEILKKIMMQDFANTKEKGDALENLVKSLFEKISLVNNVKVTSKDISLGQTDIQLVPVDDKLYKIWGIKDRDCFPESMIGECKNYNTQKVGREEIEKICWRTCKGGCLSFFIGFEFTQDALKEIADFNQYKNDLCVKGKRALIVPITVFMLETVINNKLNFCYFIRWAIQYSRNMNIANYIQKID